jgi:hypothetical protein
MFHVIESMSINSTVVLWLYTTILPENRDMILTPNGSTQDV